METELLKSRERIQTVVAHISIRSLLSKGDGNDTQAMRFQRTTVVHVLSREEIDSLLRAKWDG